MGVEEDGLTRQIIGCAMRVHRTLGLGFMEVVYQNALLHELRKAGLPTEREQRLQVRMTASS
jgi:GxxExxY protein